MKSIIHLKIFTVLIISLGSCTIQKRLYFDGYQINWHRKLQSKSNSTEYSEIEFKVRNDSFQTYDDIENKESSINCLKNETEVSSDVDTTFKPIRPNIENKNSLRWIPQIKQNNIEQIFKVGLKKHDAFKPLMSYNKGKTKKIAYAVLIILCSLTIVFLWGLPFALAKVWFGYVFILWALIMILCAIKILIDKDAPV